MQPAHVVYDDDFIDTRASVIQVAIDARRQVYRDENTLRLSATEGLSGRLPVESRDVRQRDPRLQHAGHRDLAAALPMCAGLVPQSGARFFE